jgi:hypothetical protein
MAVLKVVPSPWSVVVEWCCKHRFYNASLNALRIDEALTKLYGRAYTKAWKKRYFDYYIQPEYLSFEDIVKIVEKQEYCVACDVSDGCSECLFGKAYGECGAEGSLYKKFSNALGEDIEEKNGTKNISE